MVFLYEDVRILVQNVFLPKSYPNILFDKNEINEIKACYMQ